MRTFRRAETPEERARIVTRLLAVWAVEPDLRLGQLIGNVFDDPYNIEDFDLVQALEDFYVNVLLFARKGGTG